LDEVSGDAEDSSGKDEAYASDDDEEASFAYVAELKEEEAEQETKAQQAKEELHKSIERNETVLLGDIRGEWTNYSLVFLNKVVKGGNREDFKCHERLQAVASSG
jgi:hypothetical protein